MSADGSAPKLVPETRDQAAALLEALEGDVDRLTAEQAAAFRRLYNLDDNRKVSEQVPSAAPRPDRPPWKRGRGYRLPREGLWDD